MRHLLRVAAFVTFFNRTFYRIQLCSHLSRNMLRINMFQRNMFHLNMLVIALFTLGVSFKHVSCLVCNLCGFTVLA